MKLLLQVLPGFFFCGCFLFLLLPLQEVALAAAVAAVALLLLLGDFLVWFVGALLAVGLIFVFFLEARAVGVGPSFR